MLSPSKDEKMIALAILSLLVFFYFSNAYNPTSSTPVVLNLVGLSFKNSTVLPRSKPALFRRALGLTPGQPFELRLDRWRDLQSCGIFSNLTARVQADEEEALQIHISGFERPAVTLAPELSVGSLLSTPDISGGVRCFL